MDIVKTYISLNKIRILFRSEKFYAVSNFAHHRIIYITYPYWLRVSTIRVFYLVVGRRISICRQINFPNQDDSHDSEGFEGRANRCRRALCPGKSGKD